MIEIATLFQPSHAPRTASRRAGLAIAAALLAALATPSWARDPAVEAVRIALGKPSAQAAVAAGERAVAARPNDAEAWYFAGQAYGRMAIEASMLRKPGWATRTRDAFQTAARLAPDHLGAREGLVAFYTMAPGFMGGGKDKAAAEIAAFARRDAAGGHYLRATTLEGAAVERELRAAVRLAPAESRYRRSLAGWLEREERLPEALSVIQAGLARAPADPRLLYALGRHVAVHGGDADAGIAALGTVIGQASALPDDVSPGGAHWRRGQLLEKQGRTREALADYRRGQALQPGLKDIAADIARVTAAGR